jgi:quercetin dioxygenase-like cupin family protein
MATPLAITQFVVKSHNTPDEVRSPEKTRVEVVRLEGFALSRFSFEPGWRWSECIKPVVRTEACQVSHVGYAIAGRITVCLQDGTQKTIIAGDAYTIPPGHDACERFVCLEVLSTEQFAKP